jgi:E-phenylitaconyl-CoA hydratase
MTLLVDSTDGIVTLTINRPEARNALTPDLAAEIEARLVAFDEIDAERVAIITGAGDKAFCAGADLRQTRTLPPAASAMLARRDASLVKSHGITKPIIAAVNGYALGGGCELALTCDIRIASRNASFGLPEVQIGSLPGSGGTQRLMRLIPPAYAYHMALTGERISADEAYRVGLVTRLTEPQDLMTAAREIAQRIAANAPLSVKAVKRLMANGPSTPLPEGLALERLYFNLLRDTEDRAEGRKAFAEKRKPDFKGK